MLKKQPKSLHGHTFYWKEPCSDFNIHFIILTIISLLLLCAIDFMIAFILFKITRVMTYRHFTMQKK